MSNHKHLLEDLIKHQAKDDDDIDIDSDDLKLQLIRKGLEAERYLSDTADRKWLAIWTAIVVTLWLGAVMVVVFLNNRHIHLSDTVISVLLGTTTLNVLGLSYIVLRGHFKASEHEK
jgi:preprotein translocase subunit SecG